MENMIFDKVSQSVRYHSWLHTENDYEGLFLAVLFQPGPLQVQCATLLVCQSCQSVLQSVCFYLQIFPSTLVWTKKSLAKYFSVYPTYLPEKSGHFDIKVCSQFQIIIWEEIGSSNKKMFAHIPGLNELGVKFLLSGRPLNQGYHLG